MEFIFYKNNFNQKLNDIGRKHINIELDNEELKKIIELKKNIDHFELGNDNILEIVFKKYNIEGHDLILIKLDNYNSVIEFKNELNNYFVTIINENMMEKEEDVFNLHNITNNICNIPSPPIDSTDPIEYIETSSDESDEMFEMEEMTEQQTTNNPRIKKMIVEKLENITEKKSILSKILNLKIDNIYCLISHDSQLKKRKISSQIGKLNISIEFVMVNNYEEDSIKLHLKCIKKAKAMNYKNILIMEEDNDFNYSVFHEYLREPVSIPNDFEMLYLGGQILNGDLYDKNLIKLKSIIYNHALIINYKIFDYIIENIEKEWNTIDNWNEKEGLERQVDWNDGKIDKFYSKHICDKRKKSYCVYPLICYKEPRQLGDNRILRFKDNMIKSSGFFYKKLNKPLSVFVINEEQNKDQLTQFREMANVYFNTFNIFKAITEDFNYEKELKILELFNTKNIKENQKSHNYNIFEMNNILSHFYLWEHFANNPKEINLILEDHIELDDHFNVKLNNVLKDMEKYNWDILFLNYKNDKNKDVDNIIKLNDNNKNDNIYMNTAYLVNINSGQKIMKYIKENNIKQTFNHFMMGFFDKLNCYKLKNNICNSKIKKNKKKLLNINNVNKLINPDKEEVVLNDEVNMNDFIPLLLDNKYKEVLINNTVYFKNSKDILFKMNDTDEICYHGYIKDNKIIINHLNKNLFKMSLNIDSEKETLLFYLNDKNYIPYFLKKIIELLSLKYQVIVIGKNLYNININNVYYISIQNDEFLNKMIMTMNIKKIYTDNWNILLLVTKTDDIKINYVMYEIPTLDNYENKLYKNNGIEYMRNTYNIFENIYFFNDNLREEFKDHLNLNEIPENCKLNSLVISKNENKVKLAMKENYILSIDKHPKRVVNCFKLWNNKMNGNFKLIILNNNINSLDEENVIIDRLNYVNFNKYLDVSYFYLSFENNYNSYYNILNAINHYCIPIIPKYFSEFNNKYITFNGFLNRYNLIDMKEIYENEKKKMVYNNLADSIIKNHLKNMTW
jgi:GR25 family glycosyltransferase involved in LPS biosynthesis